MHAHKKSVLDYAKAILGEVPSTFFTYLVVDTQLLGRKNTITLSLLANAVLLLLSYYLRENLLTTLIFWSRFTI
jgi:hypothetical protein